MKFLADMGVASRIVEWLRHHNHDAVHLRELNLIRKDMSKSFTIHDLPRAERPRERLQKHGAEVLSSQELIALILGRGVKGESVMVTAQRLLTSFGNVKNISQASLEELSAIKGIGTAKATQLKAAFELARRNEEITEEQISLKSHQDVIKLVKQRLKDKKKEHFLILCLDTRSNLIKISNISTGTLDTNLVHPREVFKEAIQSLSSSIILAHNHPSGDPEPSDADIDITKRILKTGKVIGIDVLDHIIIANNKSLSFKEKGIIL
ncbi:MAG: DNA repair protein RadC [Candidatus Scalindua rubra]|uniref:DNA repair protein RadC n=1 Tax=Candidatus Scalindua rubra TaxID=1872076 RepID=A0A1E3X6X7_9BACT|nr:MAG: DNA repair protein RadC [Candidatus Scalindua rubra]